MCMYVIHLHTDESERNRWGCWDVVLSKTLNYRSASLHPDDYRKWIQMNEMQGYKWKPCNRLESDLNLSSHLLLL